MDLMLATRLRFEESIENFNLIVRLSREDKINENIIMPRKNYLNITNSDCNFSAEPKRHP